MANLKISQLPAVTATTGDTLAVVQGGVTSQATVQGIIDLVPATSDTYVTGGTYNATGGTLTLTNNDASNVVVTGITSGGASIYDASGTLSGDRNIDGGSNTIIWSGLTSFNIFSSGFNSESQLVPGTFGDQYTLQSNVVRTLVGLFAANGTDYQQTLEFFSDDITLTDTRNNKGIEYGGDYSSNFTDNSLVSKKYVDDNLPTSPLTSATTFTSIDITSMGTSPLELLPAPPIGQYYNVHYYDFKFNGALYDNLDFNHYLELSQAGVPSAGINRSLIIYPNFGSTTAQKYVRVYPGTGLLDTVTQSLYIQPNDLANTGEITLKMAKTSSPFNANPTGGGGTLEVTVTYTLETF